VNARGPQLPHFTATNFAIFLLKASSTALPGSRGGGRSRKGVAAAPMCEQQIGQMRT
jgi:hypothetical protein